MTSLLEEPQGARNQIFSEASLSPSPSLSHTHKQVSHRYDLITVTFQVSPCCPHPRQRLSLSVIKHPICPLTCPTATPVSGSLAYNESASDFNEEMSQLLPLWDRKPAGSSSLPYTGSSKSVSVLHPPRPACDHHGAKDYRKGHWHLSGLAEVLVCSLHFLKGH